MNRTTPKKSFAQYAQDLAELTDGVIQLREAMVLFSLYEADKNGWSFDLSSLAAYGNLSRTTCHRIVDDLTEKGLCHSERTGRRRLIHPTAKCRETCEKIISRTITYIGKDNHPSKTDKLV